MLSCCCRQSPAEPISNRANAPSPKPHAPGPIPPRPTPHQKKAPSSSKGTRGLKLDSVTLGPPQSGESDPSRRHPLWECFPYGDATSIKLVLSKSTGSPPFRAQPIDAVPIPPVPGPPKARRTARARAPGVTEHNGGRFRGKCQWLRARGSGLSTSAVPPSKTPATSLTDQGDHEHGCSCHGRPRRQR